MLWLRGQRRRSGEGDTRIQACVGLPLRAGLVLWDLPNSYTSLYSALGGVCCPSCQAAPPDAAICLACGSLVCAGSKAGGGGRGECTRHAEQCGGGTGIFFLVQQRRTLLVWGCKAAYGGRELTPYLDAHREAPGMALGKSSPLYLDRASLAAIERLCLQHQIPRVVTSLRNGAERVIRDSFY